MKFTTFFQRKRNVAENQHFTNPSLLIGGGYILLCALILISQYSCKKEKLTINETKDELTQSTEKVIPITLDAVVIDGTLHFATIEEENKAIESIIGKPYKSIKAWNEQHDFVSLYDVYDMMMEVYNEDTLAKYEARYGDVFHYPKDINNDFPRIQDAILLKSMLLNPKGEYFVNNTLVKCTKKGIYRILNATPDKVSYALSLNASNEHEGILFEENSTNSDYRIECPSDEYATGNNTSGEYTGNGGGKYRVVVSWQWHKTVITNGNNSSIKYDYCFEAKAQKKGFLGAWYAHDMNINEIAIQIEARRYDISLQHVYDNPSYSCPNDNKVPYSLTQKNFVVESPITVAQLADLGCILLNFDYQYHVRHTGDVDFTYSKDCY